MKNITTIGQHFDTHHLSKRMDLESCLVQFDVHHDTIIRTEESQAIGGKFLQGIGLNNLDECQRLCCETDHCDVYIFEEKAEGYCYLFECGPPENFHCKFTRHLNYTSAVLTLIRHQTLPPPTVKPSSIIIPPQLPQLQSQTQPQLQQQQQQQIPNAVINSLSQHELELTNLKQKSDLNNIQQNKLQLQLQSQSTVIPSIIGAAGTGNSNGRVLADSGIRSSEQITTPKNSQLNASGCGRFQFQCHSGECIAVYNACDGIPQCEDGSDEGPECPASTGVEGKSINAETNKLSDISNYRIPSGNTVALSKQTLQVLPRQYQQQSIQAPVINNREDPMSAPSLWANRKIQENQADMERNSHIFNHKGGLQLPTNNIGTQYVNPGANIYNPLQRDMYVQAEVQNSYQNPIIQPQDHMIPPPNVNWQQTQVQQQSLIPPGPYVITVNGQPVPQVKSLPIQPQSQINNIQIKPDIEKNNEPSTFLESNNEKKMNQNRKNHEKDKGSVEESEDYSYYEEKSTEPPKKKQRKHKKPLSKDKEKNPLKNEKAEKDNKDNIKSFVDGAVHERYKIIKEDLEMEFVDHDGQSERPGGAVLSLTLGIIVTAALAILIGCRLRTVSRRVRRIGKAPYAHEADFLVNGMYL